MACGRVTGVFGTNSSGKTSLIQFLLMMKQTKDATDRAISLELNGALVQLGTIKDAIHQHDEARSIKQTLGFTTAAEQAQAAGTLNNTYHIARGKGLQIVATIGVQARAPLARTSCTSFCSSASWIPKVHSAMKWRGLAIGV